MLHWIDWTVIVAYLLLSLAIGLSYRKRAAASMDAYFVSNRDTSWWLAGLSLVATTFAADTPLAVTELVRSQGISHNWLWWNMLLSGMLTTFFFARLWRRAGIRTELELVQIRYSGQVAQVLRGFKAVYFGLFVNALVIGWVNLALVGILQVFFGIDAQAALWYTAAAMLLTTVYASLGGLKGVIVTDAVQFGIAMLGCIILAVIVINTPQVGGLTGIKAQLPANTLRFWPVIGGDATQTTGMLVLGIGSFIAFAGVQWWASWYPGSEPGGGGYVVQRILSAKNEQHGLAATLLFMALHIAVRPWPWVLVALATLILYPNVPEAESKLTYLYTIRDYLPIGLQGLLLVSFFAAYMSTIATQLNWGTSYLVNDLYAPYLNPGKSDRHYVNLSKMLTVVVMFMGLLVTANFNSVSGLWGILFELSAGMGLVLILRWYWWRISAWSELIGTLVPPICFLMFRYLAGVTGDVNFSYPYSLFWTVGITTAAWVAATYLLPGTDPAVLRAFYQRVQPQGAWGAYAGTAEVSKQTPLRVLALCWLLGVLLVYGVLFATGKLLFLEWGSALVWAVVAGGSGLGLFRLARRWPIFS